MKDALVKRYRVLLLARKSNNTSHKYLHKGAKAKPSGSGMFGKIAGQVAAPAQQAGAQGPGKGGMQTIDNLFDE